MIRANPHPDFSPKSTEPRRCSGAQSYDRLMELLNRLDESDSAGTSCLQVAAEHGLWNLVAALHIRPQDFKPQSRVHRERIDWFRRFMVGFTRWLRSVFAVAEESNPRIEQPPLDAGQLAQVLAECQALSGRGTIVGCLPHFAPFWEELPAELAGVSERSIAWTLAARVILQAGPAAFLKIPHTDRAAFNARFAINQHSSLGDAVCLHLLLEELVQTAAEQCGLWGRNLDQHAYCQPAELGASLRGGLRTESFLLGWRRLFFQKAVAGESTSELLDAWCRLLQELAAVSPLTQAVYSDLATPVLNRGDLLQTNMAELSNGFSVLVALPPDRHRRTTTPDDSDQLPNPSETLPTPNLARSALSWENASPDKAERFPAADPVPIDRGWRLHWITLLGRSLLGGCLSPSYLVDHLEHLRQVHRQLTEQIGQLETIRRRWGGRARKHRIAELRLEQSRIEAEAKQIRSQDRTYRFARLMNLCALLGHSSFLEEPTIDLTNRAMRICLKMRFLDLLIRHFASQHMPELEQQFHREGHQPETLRRDVAMRSRQSILLDAFVRTLLGCSWQALEAWTTARKAAKRSQRANPATTNLEMWLHMLLIGTFSFALGDDDDRERRFEDWIRNSLLPEHETRQLIDRFFHDGRCGIEVSFQGLSPKTWAPGCLLESWIEILDSLFVEQNQTTEELTVSDV